MLFNANPKSTKENKTTITRLSWKAMTHFLSRKGTAPTFGKRSGRRRREAFLASRIACSFRYYNRIFLCQRPEATRKFLLDLGCS